VNADIRKDDAAAKTCGQRTTTSCPHPARHCPPPLGRSELGLGLDDQQKKKING
jgi:hypothetical protein